jgi:hypothetical protein
MLELNVVSVLASVRYGHNLMNIIHKSIKLYDLHHEGCCHDYFPISFVDFQTTW